MYGTAEITPHVQRPASYVRSTENCRMYGEVFRMYGEKFSVCTETSSVCKETCSYVRRSAPYVRAIALMGSSKHCGCSSRLALLVFNHIRRPPPLVRIFSVCTETCSYVRRSVPYVRRPVPFVRRPLKHMESTWEHTQDS